MTKEQFLKSTKAKRCKFMMQIKENLLPEDEMYKILRINREAAYEALKMCKGEGSFDKEWTEGNPTCGYCYKMTAVALQRFNPGDLVPMVVGSPKEYPYHFFMVDFRGNEPRIIDLTRNQFAGQKTLYDNFPYEKSKLARINNLTKDNNEAGKFVKKFMRKYEGCLPEKQG